MWRDHLDDVPEFPLPAGFSLRWYEAGDEAHWLRIHRAADPYNEITPELFRQQFGHDERPWRERQCYLCAPGSEIIGTGTAWFNDDFEGERWGRVHWLAILPGFQGRGLSRPLLSAICRRLRDLGHERAYLSTSTARLPAISLYLKFGFAPLMRGEWDETVWKPVLAALAGRSRPPA